MRAAPTERVAGLAFLAFIVIQVPFFLVDSDLAASGMVLLSPLQVAAASTARTYPEAAPYLEDVLVPGAWLREAFSPLVRCIGKTNGKGPCDRERARLWDGAYVRRGINLPLLVELLQSGGLAPEMPIRWGSCMIVVSALFSLYYSVKTSVVGFLLLGWGVIAGGHTPLPPGVLTAFLCVYAGFQLGELRGNQRAAAAQRKAAAAGGKAAAAGGAAARGAKKKTPGKASQRKSHKQA